MRKIIAIHQGVTRMPEWRMATPVNFELLEGEHIAIVGSNGAGKTMFVKILLGAHPLLGKPPYYDFSTSKHTLASENIKYIAFQDSYGDGDHSYYLQKRWNQFDMDESVPTAEEFVKNAMPKGTIFDEKYAQEFAKICDLLSLHDLLGRRIMSLSSGELRKIQLSKALLSTPSILIIDNPFIGLDIKARSIFEKALNRMTKENTPQIILIVSKSSDIPPFITHVVEVNNREVMKKIPLKEWQKKHINTPTTGLSKEKEQFILNLPHSDYGQTSCQDIIIMDGITVKYDDKAILNNLSWVVKRGEKWALRGPNGSGKSLLLSLICADNPQGYACNISLFGCKRGSGESIWDIKKRIGYVSAEMHRAYKKNLPALKIVASGLKDSMGLYVKPTQEDRLLCKFWMDIFGLNGFYETPFLQLSSGEQRLVLLARAFVKDPELLILDEPMHGLDGNNSQLVKDIINTFCLRKGKTLLMVSHYDNEIPTCVEKEKTLTSNI